MSEQSSRRQFLSRSLQSGAALGLLSLAPSELAAATFKKRLNYGRPIVISTWDAGLVANEAAMKALKNGGNAVDMAEQGVKVIEDDFTNLSVGLGGLPDREGHTTLDACIMDSEGRAGSVCFLEKIQNPISVARAVMEKTPHVMLVGSGAFQFAREMGFPENNFKSEEAVKAYNEWKIKSEYKPIINIENHDTIGMVTMDSKGDLSGACTTSGLSYKMRGRVGDSPIIGAGLYVDNEIGAATGTGLGETVLRTLGSFLIVEKMREGMSPQKACEYAIQRVHDKNKFMKDEFQVGFIAVSKSGEIGAFGLRPGFTYALWKEGKNEVYKADSLIKT